MSGSGWEPLRDIAVVVLAGMVVAVIVMSCGSPACGPGNEPPPEWAAAYIAIRDNPKCGFSDAPIPYYRFSDLGSKVGGRYGECGIEIHENRRGTIRALPTYTHEACHYLGLDDDHQDGRWATCECH